VLNFRPQAAGVVNSRFRSCFSCGWWLFFPGGNSVICEIHKKIKQNYAIFLFYRKADTPVRRREVCSASHTNLLKIADQAIFYLANSERTKGSQEPDNRDFCINIQKIHEVQQTAMRWKRSFLMIP
jgi:hypothetical protein